MSATQKDAFGSEGVDRWPGFRDLVFGLFMKLLKMERWQKRLLVYGLDLCACLAATLLAFSLREGALSFPLAPLLIFAAVAVCVFTPIFVWRNIYHNIFRFSGGRTIMQLASAIGIYLLPLVAIFLVWGVAGVPRTIAILQPLIFFCLTSAVRISARHVLMDMVGAHGHAGTVRQVLIYGAGAAGQQLALSSRHEPGLAVVGFIDDDVRLDGQRLDGIPVHFSGRLGALLHGGDVDSILLAIPNASRRRRAQIVEELKRHRVQVLTLPPLQQLMAGGISVSDLREIQIEDLLGRDPVQPNELLLARSITGKVVMVTGAGGSIGSELCRQIASQRPTRLVLVEMTEYAIYQIDAELRERLGEELAGVDIVPELVSVTEREAVFRIFERWRPHTVFHAAAYKHVPLVELNLLSAIRNNVVGTCNAAEAALHAGVERFILVSTDKAVRPTNVMGATKRVCELILQSMARDRCQTRFAMVRFGNVLGSSGSVVPRFMRQIRSGGPVTLTHRDVTRYFMTIPEAAQLVIQAGSMAEGGEVYLLDMGEPVRIYDLARTMISLSGLTIRDDDHPHGDIEIVEIGLRSGEKLYEELLIDSDAQATNHPRISRAREYAPHRSELAPVLERMLEACKSGDRVEALRCLRQLVPEYRPAGLTAEDGREDTRIEDSGLGQSLSKIS